MAAMCSDRGVNTRLGAAAMTTLTALKLERELQVARAGLARGAGNLSLHWSLCPRTGRPVAAWVVGAPSGQPAIRPSMGALTAPALI
jgi:hypothetical protein